MKFSIIIPVYNAKDYLSECLNSVFSQKYQKFEVIIIDDGSIDGSEEVYQAYAKRYPEYVIAFKQKNSGQLASRCRAISVAKGDYCLFLDADDILVENALMNLKKHIDEYSAPDMIVFPFFYDRDGKLEKSKMINNEITLYEGTGLEQIYREFFEGTLMNSVCTKVVRRDIAMESTKEYEKFTQLRCAEDRYQSMMMLREAKRILYITTPYYRYRIAEGSTTRQFSYDTIARFNTSIMYDLEQECLNQWKMNTKRYKEQIEAVWVTYPLYILDLFYNKVGRSVKREVMAYPWCEFLPAEVDIQSIQMNQFLDEKKKLMWEWIINKDYDQLRYYFLKKKIYKILRKIKRKIFK